MRAVPDAMLPDQKLRRRQFMHVVIGPFGLYRGIARLSILVLVGLSALFVIIAAAAFGVYFQGPRTGSPVEGHLLQLGFVCSGVALVCSVSIWALHHWAGGRGQHSP
jgi:hypothetical protein